MEQYKDNTEAKKTPLSDFNGTTNEDLISYIESRIKPKESAEDEKKREKREKREMFMANIKDALGGFHKAYSYQRGVKPMDLHNNSDKVRKRIERAKAERAKDDEQRINYMLTIDKLIKQDRDFNYKKLINDYNIERQKQKEERDYDLNKRKLDIEEKKANKPSSTRGISEYTTSTVINRGPDGKETGRTTTRTRGANSTTQQTTKYANTKKLGL